MECNINEIKKRCACTYAYCSRKGKCCECVEYHRRMGELPGCYFPPEAEKTYNRTIKYFCQIMSNK